MATINGLRNERLNEMLEAWADADTPFLYGDDDECCELSIGGRIIEYFSNLWSAILGR